MAFLLQIIFANQEFRPRNNSITGKSLKTNKQIGGNEMIKKQLLGVLVVFTILAFCGAAMAAESMTIVGTINDDGVLVDEGGALYMLGEEESSDGTKTIAIESYKVME